jgi:hypothetical protein
MTGIHKRNTVTMQESLRCGAKTWKGTPCRAPAVSGKKRCQMHGGAKGSGAPVGNHNALKHGMYTRESLELQAHVRELLREGKKIIEKF